MDKPTLDTQDIFKSLSKYEDEEDEEVPVSGARAAFDKQVYQKKPETFRGPSQESDVVELGLSDRSLSTKRDEIKKKLTAWAGGKKCRVWISDILTQQLNIPVRTYPKDVKWIFQVLFFGEDEFSFVLTLFPTDGMAGDAAVADEELMEAMRDFSTRTARMLMSSLMNFCHTEFFLLHPALPCGQTLDTNKLQEELERQMTRASEYYGGPAKLSKVAFDQLTQAASYVMHTTAVPHALGLSGRNEEWLLVMGTGWQQRIICLLNRLEGMTRQKAREPLYLTYEPEKKSKTIITVLEVTRRLSFKHRVRVVSKDATVLTAVKKLAESERNDRLSCSSPDSPPTQKELMDVIVVDLPQPSGRFEVLLTVTPEPSTEEGKFTSMSEESTSQLEKVRLLIVGETGVGRSATANTLLGVNAFRTGSSFGTITGELETHCNSINGVQIEVTESPGLFAKPPLNRFYRDTQSRTYDAVCYVIKIDRFDKKKMGVFQTLKTVLGENVVKHTIVIFTRSDYLNGESVFATNGQLDGTEEHNNNMSKNFVSSALLETLLRECGGRYLVFNNKSKAKDTHRQAFFKALRDMKEALTADDKTFTCPDVEVRFPAMA